jgi:hypothetical protein
MRASALLLALALAGCEEKPTQSSGPGPAEVARRAETITRVAAREAPEDTAQQTKREMEACVSRAAWAHDEHIRINGGKMRNGAWVTNGRILIQAEQLQRTQLEACRQLHPVPAANIGQPP